MKEPLDINAPIHSMEAPHDLLTHVQQGPIDGQAGVLATGKSYRNLKNI
jgi:hypothetical protein